MCRYQRPLKTLSWALRRAGPLCPLGRQACAALPGHTGQDREVCPDFGGSSVLGPVCRFSAVWGWAHGFPGPKASERVDRVVPTPLF